MLPRPSQESHIYSHHGNAAFVGKFLLGDIALRVSLPDVSHLGVREFGRNLALAPPNILRTFARPVIIAMRQSLRVKARWIAITCSQYAHSERVLGVVLKSSVLKIAKATVGLDRIFMVDVMAFGAPPNESSHDQYVNVNSLSLAINGQRNRKVARASRVARFQQAIVFAARRPTHSHDSAKIRYRIKSLISDYGLPSFAREFFGGKFLNRHGAILQHKVALWLEPWECFNARTACLF